MEYIEIEGGIPLCKSVAIQGSKNVALPIFAATLLIQGTCVIHNCPRIIDLLYMIQLLRGLGCEVVWLNQDTVLVNASCVNGIEVSDVYAKKMRSSVTLMGALLARMGRAILPYPGGCVIGDRPIDLHLFALSKMGTICHEKDRRLFLEATRLKGAHISFCTKSVGATQNAVLASVLAEGVTVIEGASIEPEVVSLCRFLNAAGARISGVGEEKIIIHGVKQLHEVEYVIDADRIVAGTYLFAICATKGSAVLQKAPVHQMGTVIDTVKKMGVRIHTETDQILVDATNGLKPLQDIKTSEYPGFPTDLQSCLLTTLCLAAGESSITETIFEKRFRVVPELQKMGAKISIENHGRTALVCGIPHFVAADVTAKELRGGAALCIAALAADGVTRIYQRQYIERGYEDIARDLKCLGGMVRER